MAAPGVLKTNVEWRLLRAKVFRQVPLYKGRCLSVGINIFRYALLILAYRRLHEQRDFYCNTFKKAGLAAL